MKYTLPRGTKDILPDEMSFWHYIESTSRSLFDLYNYQEIRTPVFESTDLFVRGLGTDTDIVDKEMYTFTDKGDRSLTLRPEGTAPIVRAYIQNALFKQSKQQKVYYCGPMFRYERPQAGRYRQFHQIGVENLGNAHPFSDAEVISLGVHLFDELGLSDLSVNINSVGCPVCRKVIEERLKQFIGTYLDHLCGDCQRRFDTKPLRILDCKKETCSHYFSGLPDIRSSLCQECKDHFNAVTEYLDSLAIPFNINPRLVRGLDYYTRTTFEIVSDHLGAQNAICGGGRYDYLIETMGAPPTPAVGFAFGVERAVMVLQQMSDIIKSREIQIYVAPIGFNQQTRCFYIMDSLRRAGFQCEMDHAKEDLSAQLKQANKLRARYTLIYGETEAEKNTVILKNMETRDQTEIPIDELIPYLEGQGLQHTHHH
ncbi:MAG: histidine--tRNA ligase [Candidatus Margulisiibacteriota bacterium]